MFPEPRYGICAARRPGAERRDRYVGLCHGAPGVGKTLSARHFADWDTVEQWLGSLRMTTRTPIPSTVGDRHAIIYTPDVAATPTRLASDLCGLVFGFNRLVEDGRDPADDRPFGPTPRPSTS